MVAALRRLLLIVLLLGWLAPAQAEPRFPELTGRVVDDGAILIPEVEEDLSAKLEALEQQTGRQLVIVTLPDLQGYTIEDYGYQLGRHWGIGDRKRNDGVLLIVAPNERKVRIEVGYGLEGVLTDGLSSLIINQDILPHFRSYDMNRGVKAGTDAIIAQLSLPDGQAQAIASKAQESESEALWPWFVVIGGVLLAMAFLFWLIAWIGDRFGGSSSGSHWLFRSSGGSSYTGGGGFSGGGGSFGGGGASGSW